MIIHQVGADDVSLSVREYGDPAAPHVVLVHGYPDDQTLWDDVVPLLRGFHVVTYDVRGAGESDAPDDVLGYRIDRLVDDLVSVVEAVLPAGERFHLVGHDWGAIQMWAAADRTRDDAWMRERLVSFTAMCGPSLDHVGGCLARPRNLMSGRLLGQVAHSWYVWTFQLPLLPSLAWRSGSAERALRRLNRDAYRQDWSTHLRRDGYNGVGLYRANMLPRLLRPRPHGADLPVLVVQATRDRFVTPAVTEEMERDYPRLQRAEIDAAHWLPRERPEEVAALIRDHVVATAAG